MLLTVWRHGEAGIAATDEALAPQIAAMSDAIYMNPQLFARFGRDRGADIPVAGEYVRNLKPLLDRVGNEAALTLILFTLDETTYARELAPLAGHYPCLKLGPAWWFHDSPEGMRRYREMILRDEI